jgi:hypothetical protein
MINITDADRKVAKKLAQFGKLIPEYKIAEDHRNRDAAGERTGD